MQTQGIIVFLICCTVAVLDVGGQTQEDCVSRQELDAVKNDLYYWQNTTLSVIKDLALDKNDTKERQCTCVSQLDTVLDKLDTVLSSLYSNDTTRPTDVSLGTLEQKLDAILSSLNSSNVMMPSSYPLGTLFNPATSCKDLPISSPSGHYWIQSASTGYATMAHCHMSPPCSCSSSSGWMSVVELNMTNPQDHCPSHFITLTSPKRMCRRSSRPGCTTVTFPINGVPYSRVCGKIIGYQYRSMDAFAPFYYSQSRTIDDQYVDGISLTHGQSPRQHIWTFANALDEVRSQHWVCPCTKTDSTYTGVVPPFIGNDYFCATGSRYAYQSIWYTHDPLWDGEGCGGSNTCCELNNPPWFCKDLPQPTTDDIEIRVCSDESSSNEDIALEMINIYVQ